ncbi:MAG: hypothetical protein N3E47_06345 [Candidatus Bathyarchaeota archaeon]|nr:hypothetical protein [Candidatus Bathyarchaeota archaeon]
MSVNEAMREIRAIESLIGPYEYYSYEARKVLTALRDLKNALEKMDKESIKRMIAEISNIDELAAPYRGYSFVEEALLHAKRLLSELKKIVGE